ncbi:MAG: L-2-amino-thiazoline-4-carboxylic acid hydrolase [Promethearchaeota archaeon]
MIKEGILKGSDRKEENWVKVKPALREPFQKALDRFKTDVLEREDFDPTSLLQFGLFMSLGIINVLKLAEKELGTKGQEIVSKALIEAGYEVGRQMIDLDEIPKDISDIELMSFLATIINTQAWTSIEAPVIENEDQCSFDILWCPLQDIYSAFDCRVQRYFVQGIVNYFRDHVFKSDFQIEFKSTIPAGAKTCKFIISRKKPEEADKWESYSKTLERKALERAKK